MACLFRCLELVVTRGSWCAARGAWGQGGRGADEDRAFLKGWSAVLAIVVTTAAVVGKSMLERSTLESGAAELIKLQLRGEYSARELAGVDVSKLSEAEMEAAAEELLALNSIALTSVSARGGGDDVIVKVEIQVAGGDPPDGKRVRYFRMSHGAVTGWRVERETTALSYYFKLF